jgi:hypothetical protein
MGILRTDKISGLETPTAVTGSVEFDGTGKAVSFPAGNDFAYGTGDFTIEGWFYTTVIGQVSGASASSHIFFGQTVSGTNYLLFGVDDNGKLLYYSTASGGGSDRFSSAPDGSVVLNQWQHIALCRSSGTTKAFVDGKEIISISDTFDFNNTDRNPTIGNYTHTFDTQPFNGYVSNFRILKGTALYTSDFTVPTHELEVIGDTVLLCCNNPDSAGAEATGKTATVSGSAPASTFSPGLTRDFTYGTEFKGVTTFDTQGYFVPPSGTTEQRGRGRGFFVGGNNPTYFSNIDTVQISSQGNAIRFGDLSVARNQTYGAANSTRGIVFGAYDGTSTYNFLEAFDTTTGADTIDFGNLLSSTTRRGVLGMASNTRAIAAGGNTPSRDNTIQYVTIASLGDAQEFGDLIADSSYASAATACSPTRGVMGGGTKLVSGSTNSIGYITMATTGNSVDFGDALSTATGPSGVMSSSTRGVFFHATPTAIEFITISSLGNAQEFGDLGTGTGGAAAVTNSVRGLNAGAFISPANVNTITFVNIASTGDGTDFGDLIRIISSVGGYSDSHGGIS